MTRLVCLAPLVLFLACGPIDYINTVTVKASRAVAEAKAANGEKLSPYEYWSAVEYLYMAREKASYADFEVAIDYGERSEKMAKEARRIAGERALAGPSTEENPPDLGAPPEKGKQP